MIWVAQADPLSSFTQYGIVGILGAVIYVLVKLVPTLVNKQTALLEANSKNLMEYMTQHRGETTAALAGLGSTVATSNEKMATTIAGSHRELTSVLSRQARLLDQALFAARLMERVKEAKANGVSLSADEIDRLARVVELRDSRES